MATRPELDPRCLAGIQLIERTGAKSFQLRYSDEERPTVWIAVAVYRISSFLNAHKVGAGLTPDQAIRDLCDKAIDGGVCEHCSKMTSFAWEAIENIQDLMDVCVYEWDPELKTFRRSCEGD